MTTSDYPFELSDLPGAGPTTAAAVKGALSIADDDHDDDLFVDLIVDAVNELVRGLPTAERSQGKAEWVNRTQTGATMLATRLVRRRNSPDGIAGFNAAGGIAYVQRTDPDVAMLLELGKQARPAVG